MEELKEKIEEIVAKVKADPDFAKKFQDDPVKAAEEIFSREIMMEQTFEIYSNN